MFVERSGNETEFVAFKRCLSGGFVLWGGLLRGGLSRELVACFADMLAVQDSENSCSKVNSRGRGI